MSKEKVPKDGWPSFKNTHGKPIKNPERYEACSPGFSYCQPTTSFEQFTKGVLVNGANYKGGFGRTALMWASYNGKEEM